MGVTSNRVLVFFVCVLLIVTSAAAQGNQAEGVQLFNARDGAGAGQQIPIGSFQVSGKQLSPGDPSRPNISVRVSKGYVVRFCSEANGGGKCDDYGEGTHNLLSADFNFIRVWKAPAVSEPIAVKPLIVFEDFHWRGRSQVFRPGMYRHIRNEFGNIANDLARSVVIAKGFRARFCSEEGPNYRGEGDCEVHEEGRINLRFANSISFIEVIDLSDTSPEDDKMPVVLYEDPSYNGKMQGFDVGVFLASKGQFKKLPNDQASSIAVKSGYRASVCADEPAAGGEPANCEEFGPGRKNLKNRRTASYLKVWKE